MQPTVFLHPAAASRVFGEPGRSHFRLHSLELGDQRPTCTRVTVDCLYTKCTAYGYASTFF
jgi:hypothetical protein